MSRAATAWLLCVIAACGGCSGGGGAGADGGPDGGDTDTQHTDTGTGPYSTDAGPWEWEDLPAGEDCGPGCEQVTITEVVQPREWDVWGDLLVFRNFQDAMAKVEVVDMVQRKRLIIPNVYPDHPITPDHNGTHYPVIHQDLVYYNLFINSAEFSQDALVLANLDDRTQTVLFGNADETPWLELDAFGERLVSGLGGNCDTVEGVSTACLREPPWPSAGMPLYECQFGLSMWGDRLVCIDLVYPPDDIAGYDLATLEPFQVTDDDEYQIWPRIHENRVVWQDFRLGGGEPTGSWEYCAIFSKDLVTDEVTQITGGAAIAALPDVFGDFVVWLDYRHCDYPHNKNDFENVEIYGYNLATQEEFRVTELPGRPKVDPRVWGERVFVDMQTLEGGNAIYMFDLPPEAY